jgi:hypothetical protein
MATCWDMNGRCTYSIVFWWLAWWSYSMSGIQASCRFSEMEREVYCFMAPIALRELHVRAFYISRSYRLVATANQTWTGSQQAGDFLVEKSSFSICVAITSLASATLIGRLECTRNCRRRIVSFFSSVGILAIMRRYVSFRFFGEDTRASSIAASWRHRARLSNWQYAHLNLSRASANH